MDEKKLETLLQEGIPGYNKAIYYYINNKDYKRAHELADKKMDKILDEGLDMLDEDLSLIAYTFAMNGDYESAKASVNVILDDFEAPKEEKDLDLYASLALALCYDSEKKGEDVRRLLDQALTFAPSKDHQGADEALLKQAKEKKEALS